MKKKGNQFSDFLLHLHIWHFEEKKNLMLPRKKKKENTSNLNIM